MQDSAAEAQQKQAANATKLAGLRSGARLISAADVAAVEKVRHGRGTAPPPPPVSLR